MRVKMIVQYVLRYPNFDLWLLLCVKYNCYPHRKKRYFTSNNYLTDVVWRNRGTLICQCCHTRTRHVVKLDQTELIKDTCSKVIMTPQGCHLFGVSTIGASTIQWRKGHIGTVPCREVVLFGTVGYMVVGSRGYFPPKFLIIS